MNRFCRLFLFMLMCGGLLFAAVPASAGDGTQAVQEKTPAHPEKKWRVAYIEGGGYTDYQRILAATAKGLAELGVIADGYVPIPEKTDDTRPIWDWLAEHAGGDRLVFLKDGYYSANWDAAQRAANRKALLDRIREKGDVDMIFAFGTWAGLDMATADILHVGHRRRTGGYRQIVEGLRARQPARTDRPRALQAPDRRFP